MKDPTRFYIAEVPQFPPSPTLAKAGILDPGWAPLFQTLAWILFWIIILRFIHQNFNTQLGALFTALVKRVQDGSAIQAGNFRIEAPPAVANQQVNTATSEGTEGIHLSSNQSEQVLNYEQHSTGIAEEVYLVHVAEVVTPKTATQSANYRVKVWLEAYTSDDFNECEQVIYRLHKSFSHQVIATEAKKDQFELWLNVWGEFTVIAYVKRKTKEPLWLTRYLDLPGRPPD